MPRELAQLLLDEGVVGSDGVERALARQREAGGALDTALLELGLVDEARLVGLLSRAADLPAAPLSAYEAVDPRARRVFPSKVAERHGLAPFALDGRELSLVATCPLDVGLLDEISFMLSLHLTPHVGPEWRVRSLIQRLYGGPLPPRLQRLASASGGPVTVTEPALPAVAPPSDAPAPPPAPPPPRPPPTRPAGFTGFRGAGDEPLEPLAAALAQAAEAFELDWEAEALAAPLPVAPRVTDHGPLPAGAEAAAPLDEAPPPEAGTEPEPLELDRSAPPRWTVAQARAALDAARSRDEIVLAALRYARDFFQYAGLFAVTRDAVAGHDALGVEDGAREVVRTVALYVSDPGIFRTALDALAPYLGPVARDAAGSAAVLDGLGRGSPRTALVFPILLRGRPICILYADNGQAPVSARRLGDLLLVLSQVGGAFERIIKARKGLQPAAPAWRTAPPPAPTAEVPQAPVATSEAAPEPDAPAASAGAAAPPEQAEGPRAGEHAAPDASAPDAVPAPAAELPPVETAWAPALAEAPAEAGPPPGPEPAHEPPPVPAPVMVPEAEPTPAPPPLDPPPRQAAPAAEIPPLDALTEAEEAFFASAPGAAAAPATPAEVSVSLDLTADRALPRGAPPPRVPAEALPPEPSAEQEVSISLALDLTGERALPAEPPLAAPQPGATPAAAPAPPAPEAAPALEVPPEIAAAFDAVPAPAAAAPPPPPAPAAAAAGPDITLERPLRPAPPAAPTDPATLVGAYLTSPRGGDDRAYLLARLVERAEEVAPILCEQLPGPLDVTAETLAATPAELQGPVLGAVAALGPAARGPLLALLADASPGRRRAAVALLGQLGDPSTFPALAERCFDHDQPVAEAARAALALHRRDPAMKPVPEKLRRALLSGLADKAPAAARAIAALRDAESIPLLIQALEGSDPGTAAAAAEALAAITLQRHGVKAREWLLWWKQNRSRQRTEWLFGALTSGDRELRVLAAGELRAAAATPVTYSADLPEAERRAAAEAWQRWFQKGGHRL